MSTLTIAVQNHDVVSIARSVRDHSLSERDWTAAQKLAACTNSDLAQTIGFFKKRAIALSEGVRLTKWNDNSCFEDAILAITFHRTNERVAPAAKRIFDSYRTALATGESLDPIRDEVRKALRRHAGESTDNAITTAIDSSQMCTMEAVPIFFSWVAGALPTSDYGLTTMIIPPNSDIRGNPTSDLVQYVRHTGFESRHYPLPLCGVEVHGNYRALSVPHIILAEEQSAYYYELAGVLHFGVGHFTARLNWTESIPLVNFEEPQKGVYDFDSLSKEGAEIVSTRVDSLAFTKPLNGAPPVLFVYHLRPAVRESAPRRPQSDLTQQQRERRALAANRRQKMMAIKRRQRDALQRDLASIKEQIRALQARQATVEENLRQMDLYM